MTFPNSAGKHAHDALPRSSHFGLVSTEEVRVRVRNFIVEMKIPAKAHRIAVHNFISPE